MKNNHFNHPNHEETEAHLWFSHYMPNLAQQMEANNIQDWVIRKNLLKKALNNNYTNRMRVRVHYQPIEAKTYELTWVKNVLGSDPFASFEQYKIDFDIIEAAQNNNVEQMIFLMIAGASLYGPKPDSRNSFILHQNSPLHQAAEKGHVKTISFLLEETGILPEIKNESGMTIFDIAVLYNQTDAASYLYSQKEGTQHINDMDHHKRTPLHLAAKHPEMINLLLKSGAAPSLNAKDQNGSTPLHLAVQGGEINAVKALLKAGTRLDIKDNQGKTPIDYASSEQIKNLVNLAQLMQDLHIKANEGCFNLFKLFLVSFKNKQEKNQIFDQLEKEMQNAADQKSSKTVNQFIDDFLLDGNKKVILGKHRNLFFKEDRGPKKTTSENFIDDIKRKYGNVKLSI